MEFVLLPNVIMEISSKLQPSVRVCALKFEYTRPCVINLIHLGAAFQAHKASTCHVRIGAAYQDCPGWNVVTIKSLD